MTQDASGFDPTSGPATRAASATSTCDPLGTIIGRYKVLNQIGEGGMGVVYLAEQRTPVQRRVALKIIKPGMDSGQVTARFEAERQALASMDHPHIARVLDAGTTDQGRPFFVMELVKGVPITDYCDANRLTPRARLELFISVCQGVQHAHQKGIIHRDLKPSNVLVADYDNKATAKIIDFGVAKAVGQPLSGRTIITQLGQVVGTVEYMSCEQAKLNPLDIDTRTDIYSLGVLLYELLSGETPFDRQRLRAAAFDEMLRIIREEEPPQPSTRLSSSEALPSIAANRRLDPKTLRTTVAGDLDWIVMRSLEKDRARRYQTAAGLAEEIQRYLADEPVEARGPTRAYRLKKFIGRNKLACAAASGIAISVIFGLRVSTWMFLQENEARKRATSAERQAKLLADKSQQVAIEFGHSLWQLGDALATSRQRNDAEPILAESAKTFEQTAKDFPDAPVFRQEYAFSQWKIGEFLCHSGRIDEAETHFRTSISEYAALARDFPNNTSYAQQQANSNVACARALQSAGRHDEANELFRRAAQLNRHWAESGDATSQELLAEQYEKGTGVSKDPAEAMKWYRLAANQGNTSARTNLGYMFAGALSTNQDDVEAVKWFRLAADQNSARSQLFLGEMYARGRGVEKSVAQAAKWFRRAADHCLRVGGINDVWTMNELAWQLALEDDLSLRDPETAVELAQRSAGLIPNEGTFWNTLGAAQYRAGNWHDAVTALKKSIELRHGGDGPDFFFLAMALQRLDKRQEARQWYDKGVDWTKTKEPKNGELWRFQDEASKTLGIAEP